MRFGLRHESCPLPSWLIFNVRQEEMRYPRFKFPTDRAKQIPAILTSEGLVVTTGHWMANAASDSKEFGYTISDGVHSLELTGATINEQLTLFLFCPVWNWRPWRRVMNQALLRRSQTAL